MPDAKGWFPRSGVERFKEEAGGPPVEVEGGWCGGCQLGTKE